MKVNPLFPEFLRIAYGCMACDGEIVKAEVSCLRSIAVQMGHPTEQVNDELETFQREFVADAHGIDSTVRRTLSSMELSVQDSELLLEMLVQLVEADGVIQPNEMRYIRGIVDELDLDRQTLRDLHPEWKDYLVEDIRATESIEWPFADASKLISDIGLKSKAT